MNAHAERRDSLMRAARTLKTWIDNTKAQRIPPSKHAMPGAVDTYHECVKMARVHNHLAMQQARGPQI